MAQLVAVLDQEYQFQKRQLPLVVDDTLTMVIEFSDICTGCCIHPVPNKSRSEIDTFVKNLSQLSSEDICSAVQLSRVEVMNQLSQLVHCVGCRNSVERLFDELVDTPYLAIDPLIITKDSVVTVTDECRSSAKELFSSICMRRSHTALELASRGKKGKRCPLHSLDLHKSKALWTWQEVWDVSTQQCQNHIVQIDNEGFLVTVEEYLRKHRFCSECKTKVLRAYAILVDEPDAAGVTTGKSANNAHCRALFREVRTCPDKRHIHVPCDEKYLKDLIERAEPELSGSQVERHAKSMEIAQEEVLTCLGVHLHDRFFRIQQKLKVEDKSWQLLFAIGIEGIRRNLEAAFERRRGNVESICRELMMDDSTCLASPKTSKRPRQKKKKSKAVSTDVIACCRLDSESSKKVTGPCQCTSGVTMRLPSSDANHNDVTSAVCSSTAYSLGSGRHCVSDRENAQLVDDCGEFLPLTTHSDLGYASDVDCESCSVRNQQLRRVSRAAGSDLSHSSGCCLASSAIIAQEIRCFGCLFNCHLTHVHTRTWPVYVGRPGLCNTQKLFPTATPASDDLKLNIECREGCSYDSAGSSSPVANSGSLSDGLKSVVSTRYGTAQSLEDMLMASEDDNTVLEISEMEIRKYRDNEQNYARERLVLRQNLRQKFASLQQKCHLPWRHGSCVHDVPSGDSSVVVLN